MQEHNLESIVEHWPANIQGIYEQFIKTTKSNPINAHTKELLTQLTDLGILNYNINLSSFDVNTPFPTLLVSLYPALENLGINKQTSPHDLQLILESDTEAGLGSKLIISMIDRLFAMKNIDKVLNRISKW